ncbi:MAG: hypothetical protein KIT84_20035 [Labilithrix sp.]|nr:hypothetical protein [Labilithrix sp.]MCW5813329.1 hypothetical protein [Labilithrix sp.]
MGRCASLVALAAASSLLAGCHFGALLLVSNAASARGPYRPESLARELGAGSVRTIGCLDVGLVPFRRDGGDLVDLHVGNRCGYPEALDMRRTVITGYSDTGAPFDVAFSDPRGEIELLHLGGADHARERIRLDRAGAARRLCFDLERIDPDAPAARPRPLCFARNGGAWVPA